MSDQYRQLQITRSCEQIDMLTCHVIDLKKMYLSRPTCYSHINTVIILKHRISLRLYMFAAISYLELPLCRDSVLGLCGCDLTIVDLSGRVDNSYPMPNTEVPYFFFLIIIIAVGWKVKSLSQFRLNNFGFLPVILDQGFLTFF